MNRHFSLESAGPKKAAATEGTKSHALESGLWREELRGGGKKIDALKRRGALKDITTRTFPKKAGDSFRKRKGGESGMGKRGAF